MKPPIRMPVTEFRVHISKELEKLRHGAPDIILERYGAPVARVTGKVFDESPPEPKSKMEPPPFIRRPPPKVTRNATPPPVDPLEPVPCPPPKVVRVDGGMDEPDRPQRAVAPMGTPIPAPEARILPIAETSTLLDDEPEDDDLFA